MHRFTTSLKSFALIISLCLLTACGFQLRGAMELPPQLHILYLQSNNPYGEFTRALRSSLAISNIKVVDDPTQAPYTLNILTDSLTTHQTSVGGSQQTRDYLATYTVKYDIQTSEGVTLYGPVSVSDQTTITVNENEVLTNSNKLTSAKQTMEQNLLNKMRFQLTSKALKNAVEKSAPLTKKK